MNAASVVERFAARADPVRAGWFRGPRVDLVLPLLEAIGFELEGARVIEIGSGEPLLLARALAERGARVTAVDPALADPRVTSEGIELVAARVEDVELEPADLTVSTLLFGAPLRQEARRRLRDEYVRGPAPDERRVAQVQARVEEALIEKLARWTRPGGWSLHVSLEALYAAPSAVWEKAGLIHVLGPEEPLEGLQAPSWARRVLSGTVLARCGRGHDAPRADRAECEA